MPLVHFIDGPAAGTQQQVPDDRRTYRYAVARPVDTVRYTASEMSYMAPDIDYVEYGYVGRHPFKNLVYMVVISDTRDSEVHRLREENAKLRRKMDHASSILR